LLRRRRPTNGHEAESHRFQCQEEGHRAHFLIGHNAPNPLLVYQGEEMLHQGEQRASHVVVPWPAVHMQSVPGGIVEEELRGRSQNPLAGRNLPGGDGVVGVAHFAPIVQVEESSFSWSRPNFQIASSQGIPQGSGYPQGFQIPQEVF